MCVFTEIHTFTTLLVVFLNTAGIFKEMSNVCSHVGLGLMLTGEHVQKVRGNNMRGKSLTSSFTPTFLFLILFFSLSLSYHFLRKNVEIQAWSRPPEQECQWRRLSAKGSPSARSLSQDTWKKWEMRKLGQDDSSIGHNSLFASYRSVNPIQGTYSYSKFWKIELEWEKILCECFCEN